MISKEEIELMSGMLCHTSKQPSAYCKINRIIGEIYILDPNIHQGMLYRWALLQSRRSIKKIDDLLSDVYKIIARGYTVMPWELESWEW